MKMQFEAGNGVNFLWGGGIYAEVEIPDGCSEDYGYLTMKQAILKRFPGRKIEFPYDGQEQCLADDASADCEVIIDAE